MNGDVLERNRNLNRGFRKLDVWREGVELYAFVKQILDNTKGMSFKIKDQVMSSVFSVSSNIAEGYCRRSIKEYIQFINISLGSAGENYSQLYTLLSSNDISRDSFDEYDKRHYSLENKLIKLAKSLSKNLKDGGDWNSSYKT
ncbi:MAG: four helix bundle protein [Desulfobacteraceae bacterium]|nr:four helix bundle protein [Desulfobacteraceae bacterium]